MRIPSTANQRAESDVEIRRLGAAEMQRRQPALVALLVDAIESGASVGFMQPIDRSAIEAYWSGVAIDVRAGSRACWAAFAGERLVGTVQLLPCAKANQPHRADVQKLLVQRERRGRGIGAALMAALEAHAAAIARPLLTLDTRSDSEADRLYVSWGWSCVGRIPAYAFDPDGTLASCTLYYKRLDAFPARADGD